MLKTLFLIAVCVFVFVECKPSGEELNNRVVRQVPNPLEAGMNVAAQMANAAAEAAQKAMEMSKQMMHTMTQGATGAMQKVPARTAIRFEIIDMDFEHYRDSNELLEEKESVSCWRCVCLSAFTRYVLPSFFLGIVILVSIYFSMLFWLPPHYPENQSTCHLQARYYVPCLSNEAINPSKCLEVGCCWRNDFQICYHAFPSPYNYKLQGFNNSTNEGVITSLSKNSPEGIPIYEELSFYIKKVNDFQTRIALKTTKKLDKDFNYGKTNSQSIKDFGHFFDFLPIVDNIRVSKFSTGDNSSTKFFVHHEPQFSITSWRSENENSTLLSTAMGPLIVTKNYWEWTLYLTHGTVYGLNNIELNGTRNWIYNNERETMKPVFLAIDFSGNAMACLIDYTGPMEVQVLNESNLVILKGFSVPDEIGIELLSGPTALKAVQQLVGVEVSKSNGLRALETFLYGLQVCPEEKRSTPESKILESLKDLITRMGEFEAPWDSHCLCRNLSLALEHDLTQTELFLVNNCSKLLREEGKTLAMHLTPMLFNNFNGSLQESLQKESCLLRNENIIYTGSYDEKKAVYYPNWMKFKTNCSNLALESLEEYKKDLSPDFIVLRDSWPKDDTGNELPENQLHSIPKELRKEMSRLTIPWNLDEEKHFIEHNLYAEAFAEFVGKSSVAVELRGHECNSRNSEASWSSLRKILETGVVSAMLGQMPTAMYVCGADTDSSCEVLDTELCIRWYGVAVMWPRIIVLPEKSPPLLCQTNGTLAAHLLRLRASLATYQHTVLARYAKEGQPIFSTTLLNYPTEKQPWDTKFTQFFWGDSILVGLVTSPRQYELSMWLPGKDAWRHLIEGQPIRNKIETIAVDIGEIVTLVKPGRIVPLHQNVTNSTSDTMKKCLKLAANLICPNKKLCQAEGSVYYGNSSVGEFLSIELLYSPLSATLTLKNVNKVKSVACKSVTQTQTQTTIIETVELLEKRNFTTSINLCMQTSDSPSFPLNSE